MGRWSDLAARMRAADEAENNRSNSHNSPAVAPIAPNVPIVPGVLPPSISAGLEQLRTQPAPRLSLPQVWPQIVDDAHRLASEGWAEKALSLGWSALHLWGAHLETPGLAVWLCGRRIALLGDSSCTVISSPERRSIFNLRPPAEGTCFLWEYGRRGR
jgi:hypothetical protein